MSCHAVVCCDTSLTRTGIPPAKDDSVTVSGCSTRRQSSEVNVLTSQLTLVQQQKFGQGTLSAALSRQHNQLVSLLRPLFCALNTFSVAGGTLVHPRRCAVARLQKTRRLPPSVLHVAGKIDPSQL